MATVERLSSSQDEGSVGAHNLAEVYAVLTRLPISPRIQPRDAAKIVEDNIGKLLKSVGLTPPEYLSVVRSAADQGISGGAIYDLLLLTCAEKAGAERIYTFNVQEFRKLAPRLADRIMAP